MAMTSNICLSDGGGFWWLMIQTFDKVSYNTGSFCWFGHSRTHIMIHFIVQEGQTVNVMQLLVNIIIRSWYWDLVCTIQTRGDTRWSRQTYVHGLGLDFWESGFLAVLLEWKGSDHTMTVVGNGNRTKRILLHVSLLDVKDAYLRMNKAKYVHMNLY